ncbi:hypothetical protein ACH4F6_37935 [Streptomyces sp. NPDC017936]|uniref:hypothetical protein n=1 Tax=Streptomyces sp. NPDC017936 TaxID=3365016 RepID=UPI00378FA8BC
MPETTARDALARAAGALTPAREVGELLDAYRDEVRQEILGDAERAMLRYAVGCAREVMDDRADEFSDADVAALESLRRLANGPVVAYRNSHRPGVLLCREHGDGWVGLTPLHAHDLPDGGTCTHGDPADPSDVCGRNVLA